MASADALLAGGAEVILAGGSEAVSPVLLRHHDARGELSPEGIFAIPSRRLDSMGYFAAPIEAPAPRTRSVPLS